MPAVSCRVWCRTAKKRDIVKAYRKLAGVWHPDKFELEREKAAAHRKFMELAAAKEVLTDPGDICGYRSYGYYDHMVDIALQTIRSCD